MNRIQGAKMAATSLLVAVAFLMAVHNVNAAETPLPAEAQKAFDRGQIAAEQGAWDLAILFFSEAQKKAERDPRVLYSLGVAHANAGHELVGAVWLNAYLAAAQKAPNAKVVRQEIARLEAIAQDIMKKIFAAALDAARQISSDEVRKVRLLSIMQRQAFTDNWEEARKTEEEACKLWCSISPDEADELKPYFKSVVWKDHVFYLSEVGELKKAQDALANVEDKFLNIEASCYIATGHTRMGDFVSAEKTLQKVEIRLSNLTEQSVNDTKTDKNKTAERMLGLAKAYAVNGQVSECQRVLNSAKNFAEQNNLDSEIRAEIAAALKRDHKDESLRATPDAVKEWVDLAKAGLFSTQTSGHNLSTGLKSRLEWANNDTTPDGIANGLAAVALGNGNGLRLIRGLEKKFSPEWQAFLQTNAAGVGGAAANLSIRPKLKATVETKIAACVSTVKVKPGDKVHAGDVLATLDDRNLSSQYEMEKADFERSEALFKKGVLSRHDYDRAAAEYSQAMNALRYTIISAPFDGVVVGRSCDVGQFVQAGQPLFELEASQPTSK